MILARIMGCAERALASEAMSLDTYQPSVVGLPGREPTLVLVGSTNPAVTLILDRMITKAAKVLDLRSSALWTEVEDGQQFLEQVLQGVTSARESVRFGFAPHDATVNELLNHALLAPTLDQLANELTSAKYARTQPHYTVRYQPIVSLSDRSIIGFESLIRANRHTSGVDGGVEELSAAELIHAATAGGWLGELDALGRRLALESFGDWLGEGLLFLNVMAPSGAFDDDAILRTIEQAAKVGLAPDQIVFEAVERNRYDSLDDAAQQIEQFRSHGIRIAVDDVGDGFSSLRTVVAFKPDIVKIAGTMAAELGTPQGKAVVRAIVQLAHETGAWVIAENIETLEQAEQAAALGVDWGQGHYFGAPGLP